MWLVCDRYACSDTGTQEHHGTQGSDHDQLELGDCHFNTSWEMNQYDFGCTGNTSISLDPSGFSKSQTVNDSPGSGGGGTLRWP